MARLGVITIEYKIVTKLDVLSARNAAKHLAEEMGFSKVDTAKIDLAVSELAHNLFLHAEQGKLKFNKRLFSGRKIFEAVALDCGPGIDDLDQAFQQGFSTKDSLGIGLNSIMEVVDEFLINSKAGEGTQVIVRKWL
ncbi:MAG: anti-sigma regulatory factor [Desulfitobacteriaceae bacterium]|nr:anti-sigma regulatory factor [Desulfitobacteriaceae bacterium]MDD4346491.1 anti-sigma regulatory factor [Desulfitobacteriaceae bacterium]MDD4401850.1 anti-sigma regulatory factor [Desulfitobacteriaceae bacterium]